MTSNFDGENSLFRCRIFLVVNNSKDKNPSAELDTFESPRILMEQSEEVVVVIESFVR